MTLVHDDLFINMLNHAQKNTQFLNLMKGTGKQMAYAAAGAGVGGLALGPPGALVGTIVAGIYGYFQSEDYSGLFTLARQMDANQREEFVAAISTAMSGGTILHFIEWFKDSNNKKVYLELLVPIVAVIAQHNAIKQ